MTELHDKALAGSIVCVGLGMTLGAHISQLTRNFIEQADVVFVGASDALVENWVMQMNGNTISLQSFYAENKDRKVSYQQMVDAMMNEIRKGHKVVGAFYGHPGVFAWAPHQVIATAKQQGFHAHMEPGISAEDCMYADMSIDPGTFGIQHYEASQFMMYQRHLDPTAYLILWQLGFVGDLSRSQYKTGHHHRQLLIDVLAESIPLQHQVAIYECPTLPTQKCRIEWVNLADLNHATVYHHSTLVIPPIVKKKYDLATLAKLNDLNSPN
ncbi:SAM-dependent methyltransferase [Aliiglaciecola sp. LCG003]|uniref:SAM-dependent methyltransferase n=1 Tax=Aliiglaciecola sp. LCG003 TaxID=3053655 RepID=UPI0025731844|nr:SAM-dependent methyltransferase [Aliiglaciecola sp. LCG003]WJG07813.1 SAM-dependent methyltransferase [Aliiglaciecola sp. LCG003]